MTEGVRLIESSCARIPMGPNAPRAARPEELSHIHEPELGPQTPRELCFYPGCFWR